MGISIANLKKEDINNLLADKASDYYIIMRNFCSEEDLKEKSQTIAANGIRLIGGYDDLRTALKGKQEETSVTEASKKSLESLEKEIEDILNNEYRFLDFITRSNDNEFGKYVSGVAYVDSTGKELYSGINKAIKYSVVNALALTDVSEKDTFFYPEEESRGNESTLFQIRDRIVIDMCNIFGDDLFRMYFMNRGKEFHDKLEHMAIMEVTYSGNFDMSNDEILNESSRICQEFSDGIDNSINKNEESYYNRYLQRVKNYKDMINTVDWTQIDDLREKRNKSLK